MPSKLDTFFATHPVFTVEELDRFLSADRPANTGTRQALLSHHQRHGHVLRIRRGIYASIPAGTKPSRFPVDPFLVASRLTDDAVLAYHTALAFEGHAHSARNDYTVVTAQPHVSPLRFQGNAYRAVAVPASLLRSGQADLGTYAAERAGLPLRVSGLERTLVDVLDRPDLGGGWEEAWQSFADVGYLDVDLVVRYALALDNATVAAKAGYFLDGHRETLGVTDEQLDALRVRRPRQPRYLGGQRRDARFVPAWNLMVPKDVFGLTWREVA